MANEYVHDLDAIGAVDAGSLLAIEDTASPTDLKKVTIANLQTFLNTGNRTITGDLTVTGNIVGVGGAFSGAVSGTTGTFSGAVSGTDGTFAGGNLDVGVDKTQEGIIKAYGDNAGEGGQLYLYNGVDDYDTVKHWKMQLDGIDTVNALWIGPDTDPNAFIFGNNGDLAIVGDLTVTGSGIDGGAAADFTISSKNSKSLKLFEDAGRGLTIADGGLSTFSHGVTLNSGNLTLSSGGLTLSGNIILSGGGATVDGVDISAHATNDDAHHAKSHVHAASAITSGTLGTSRGGTGVNSLSANRVMISGASATTITSSSITKTELEYLNDVSSSIQNQLNNKLATSTYTSHASNASAHHVKYAPSGLTGGFYIESGEYVSVTNGLVQSVS